MMLWFLAFLAVMAAQSIAQSDEAIACANCVSKINTQLKLLRTPNNVMEVLVLNTTDVKISFLLDNYLSALNTNECPRSDGSYQLRVRVYMVTLESSVKTTLSDYITDIHNFYSKLVNATKLPCQNGATVSSNIDNITSLPDLNISRCNDEKLSFNSPKKVEVEFFQEFRDFILQFTVHNSSDGHTRISHLGYWYDSMTFRAVRNYCHVSNVDSAYENVCECILTTVFQKAVFETVIPIFLACHVNKDVFEPLRDALNCLR